MLVGYARVSTKKQRLDLQLKALEASKCDLVVSERLSGGAGVGRGLLAAIGSCRRGDTLIVWKLDRMSRNLRELLAVLDVLKERGIRIKVLTGAGSAIDLSQIEGPALYTAYAAFAELERNMTRERTLAGLVASVDKRSGTANTESAAATQTWVARPANRRSLSRTFNRMRNRRLRHAG